MARIVIVGAGTGGVPAAYEIREMLGREHEVLLINESPKFKFVPSNPWVAVGWRKAEDISFDLEPYLAKKGVRFLAQRVDKIHAGENRLILADGTEESYDFLVITTGPRLAFDQIKGAGPAYHTRSICTLEHAEDSFRDFEKLVANPGPVVVGAFQGASCFGPAYEYAFILDKALRDKKIRHKVPITFVTAEPYIGHMGLGGVGDSKTLLESELRNRHIKWITNASVKEVTPDAFEVEEYNEKREVVERHSLPYVHAMMIPPFTGVEAVASVEGLCNPKGFVLIDDYQRNPTYPNIYSAGVCVAIPPVEETPVPTGTPKTGYMIESMVTAIAHNIKAELEGKSPQAKASWNAICLADMGDNGAAFVAMPQIPPRNVTWFKKGKWVHLAKLAFEKYFLRKMKKGTSEPIYEKYILKALGVEKLE
ncbi:NAD(P)/FAD-dependent oxidoreductase [Luteithermobacter gelatinilyticus]|uniref:NAD(P)/FAD-dependent oxidoreductase n=1 Tax=Luteithermobacter gelatinilyticus TaxID=2582913 RepID=UPI0011074894|nr:FAD/NAD(P)-binding oxidoreductase [Luteithermobacter gelatinilyticus]|tara:strand:- start:9074 stop:10342 length:1269 start_codon:yes stop_codon:yes gene_type:complete